MTLGSGPVSVWCFVLDHGNEWLAAGLGFLQPGNAFFSDEVIAVAFESLSAAIHLDEVWVVVGALAGEDLPVVEADGM